MAADKQQPSQSQQSTLSAFFKPSQQPKRPTPASTSDILILSDSDDDDSAEQQQQPLAKKVKLEHTAQLPPPPTQQQKLFGRAAAPSTPAPAPAPGPAPKRLQPSAKVLQWRYEPSALPSSSTDPPSSTNGNTAQREKLARKLLGKNLLQRKTAYLQEDHYMSSNAEASNSGSRSPAFGASGEDDEDDLFGGEDAEERDEQEVVGKGKGKAATKGKGKGKDAAKEQEQQLAGSRFAKFAAKGSGIAEKASVAAGKTGGKVKYTPLELQVIALQEANPGVLLAIEVGYKYRFWSQDAITASRILGIAHFPSKSMITASIPTHRLNVHLKRLISAGLKVGVVRQAETAALKKASDNRSAPFTRKLAALYTSATYIDELQVDPLESVGSRAPTLMCLVEDQNGKDSKVKIGMLAVVPSTGEVIYDEFDDTLMRSELETRMLHLQPSELVLQKDMSKQTESLVKHLIGSHDAGVPGFTCRVDRIKKRLTPAAAHSFVSDFLAKTQMAAMEKGNGKEKVDLGEMVLDDDENEVESEVKAAPPSTTILDLPSLVLIALSSLITHLSSFQLETVFQHSSSFTHFTSRSSMNLNGNTLTNLEVLVNSTDGKQQGSLLSVLDHCKTAFGRRRLRQWVSRPLVSVQAVTDRLDAVTEISSNASSSALTLCKLRELFRGLPDLERGLVRIHFGKATPAELVRVLQAFERVAKEFEPVEEGDVEKGAKTASSGLKSRLLKEVVESLPSLRDEVERYLRAIDRGKAREGKKEEMFKELTEEMQDCRDCLDAVHYELSELLADARKVLKKPDIDFIKVGEEEYLLEVRIAESKKIVPTNWVRINSTKAVYRFRPPAVQSKIEELAQRRERMAAAANVAYSDFLKLVTTSYESFRLVISNLATADVLFSFGITAISPGYCRPSIVSDPGRIEIVDGRHPIIEVVSSQPFVPNSVQLGAGGTKQMILTGLNMGGKSSLSRSVALIALMAQIGCYVPAESCTTSLFDLILTRMGASDEIARGRSTFMVEMSECSEILKMATPRSLVILDELGRGTSTSDGQAIASAVLQHIVTNLKSTTIFVTHYPSLADLVKRFPDSLSVHHMSCLESPRDDGFVDVTFLYTIRDGLASRSHGLNVARLADLPESVLAKALVKSKELEEKMEARVLAKRSDRFAVILKALMDDSAVNKEQLVEACLAALS